MYPFLFDWVVNGHHIRPPSFGVFLAIAFSSGYFLSLINSKYTKLSFKTVEVLFLLSVFSSAVFGRLFHVFFEEWPFYRANPQKLLAIWEGGFTFYGSVCGTLLAFFIFSRFRGVPFLEILDLSSVSCSLGLAIGRIGCFLAGCCWGKVCNLPWGVVFSHPESAHQSLGFKLHPTQLYECLGGLFLFWIGQRMLSTRKYPGQVGFTLLVGYGFIRFVVEYFRGDSYRGFIIQDFLSTSQFISVLLIVTGLSSISYWSRKTTIK